MLNVKPSNLTNSSASSFLLLERVQVHLVEVAAEMAVLFEDVMMEGQIFGVV